MAKTKKQKKDKNSGKPASAKKGGGVKAIVENPLVAEVIAAALVATAAALKDSNRARALASDVGDELGKLSKAGSERSSALWDMALEIGKRSLAALGSETTAAKRSGKKSAADAGTRKGTDGPAKRGGKKSGR